MSDAEDAKIVTLARSAKARVAATSGACARDTTGRTYASADVTLGEVHLSAIVLAVAQAVASGATGLEAVAVTGSASDDDLAAVRAAGGAGIPVLVVDNDGEVASVVTT